jgi:pimeloyl-ACP methyl ester carboxylesterase
MAWQDGHMSQPSGHTLEVPGARLYFEVQGSGPVLMLIGQPMGIEGFSAVAPLLAEDYTVVTYDPRGFSRSLIEDPDQDAEPDVLADDVRRVLEEVGDVPARVFGSSGGAITGLALVTRYSDHVHTLVAHEPPVGLLLPDPNEARVGMQEIYDTFRNSGIGAAWQRFMSFTGMNGGAPDSAEAPANAPPAEPPPPSAEEVATSTRFFAHGLLPIALYEADLAMLQAAPTRMVIAGGAASKGEFPQRTAAALAQRLGLPLIDFPGGHVGFITEPQEFVTVLRRCLA